ncbi:MAG: tyrosine-type recombinase/integrase [Methylovulum miyakonense]|uniref:phage integrase n=1 Tax=Methylovulum miyakonense TaxID=645578 RepID=UPI003BB4D4B3
MTVKKQADGRFKLDIRPDGSTGRRIIKLFKTKSAAIAFERQLFQDKAENQQTKQDDRKLNELIELWYELHGRSLKSAADTKNRLLRLSQVLDNPAARLLDSSAIAHYRKERLGQGISEATMNRELITLKALFRELKRMSVIDYDSDVLNIRKLREKKTELTYLTHEQISTLLLQVRQSNNVSLLYVVLICLATGSRWSEAETLKPMHCLNGGFQFADTKNGSSRFVPVDDGLLQLVRQNLPFESCYSAFRSAFERCKFTVPKGQLAHILRHSFASHFIMNGGNIRTLQNILGHSSLQMTMRYTHLAPDYMNQAKILNPLQTGKMLESLLRDIKKPLGKNT